MPNALKATIVDPGLTLAALGGYAVGDSANVADLCDSGEQAMGIAAPEAACKLDAGEEAWSRPVRQDSART